MNFIKNPTVIIVVLGLLVGGGLYFYNSYQNSQKTEEATISTEETTTITDLTNADPNDFVTENKTELALAESKAKAYNAAEILSGVEITIPGDLVPRSGNTTYIYDQVGDSKNHFAITISQSTQTYIRAVIPKEDYFSDLTPINTKSWKLSYLDALKVAEKNGGQEWRSQNLLDHLTLVLRHDKPKNWLYWIITYQGDSGNLRVQVDAYTGRFVPEDEIAESTNPTTNSNTTQTNP